ncbi:MAG: carboxypeptidase regulatory-like domain-containing protein [Gemmatimonadetes bacterium]|nr:carboxypeptidase regulatory-like domain-containing protein [Gemmatimonadota bacterium]MBK9549737.1 carboxypeptidase regulatory-like domain-containing protein [Gemmatimonadota bacterium]MBL0178788.1 carboxypeptidase regulatory-like domain-containing protein [Gemmatimonadota bacterium]MBP7620882.1 carboxypeptidase regulatory-like domain-containing protein [Gemmatimonadales bacterium]MBP9898589.1 carboxypeptidase regulatory-like domain-containing protein [Gemmatimonadales bacterium]
MSSCRLSGVVRDPSGSPVRSALVVLLPTGVGTVTGVGGEFALHLPPGRFRLQVQAAGYKWEESEELHLSRGAVVRQEIVLTPRHPAANLRPWRERLGPRASLR